MTDNEFYPMVHSGTARIFTYEWARNVLVKTYTYVIVDEYQDCVQNQHAIFIEINKSIPVYVLVDPLQAIFGFSEKLVSWKNLGFEILKDEIETYPWRWDKTNRKLGQYLNEVRNHLLPGLNKQEIVLPTVPNGNSVYRIHPQAIHGQELYRILNQYQSVLYIAKWPNDTTAFAKSMGGIFQNDEAQNLKDLYKYTQLLDVDDGHTRANALFDFIVDCASGVATELKSYEGHIKSGDYDFHMIKKHPEFGNLILRVYQRHSLGDMLILLEWVKGAKEFRLHRRELFSEMQRAIRRSRDMHISITQSAQEIRMVPGNQSKYSNFKRLSSRTLLSKGLEFDCVIIDLSKVNQGRNNRYSSTEMYVAMTRAMKAIYFITDKDSVLLEVPKGI